MSESTKAPKDPEVEEPELSSEDLPDEQLDQVSGGAPATPPGGPVPIPYPNRS